MSRTHARNFIRLASDLIERAREMTELDDPLVAAVADQLHILTRRAYLHIPFKPGGDTEPLSKLCSALETAARTPLDP